MRAFALSLVPFEGSGDAGDHVDQIHPTSLQVGPVGAL